MFSKNTHTGQPLQSERVVSNSLSYLQKGFKVSCVGTKDGAPAIEWWRHGVAVKGEPSIVTTVQLFTTIAERDASYYSAINSDH